MKIREVAKQFNLTEDTLRYYEKIGLLPTIKKSQSGVRSYSEEDLKAVSFVKCMRSAGVSIETLSLYMSMFRAGEETHEKRKALLKKELEKINERIKTLEDSRDKLIFKIEHYDDIMRKA